MRAEFVLRVTTALSVLLSTGHGASAQIGGDAYQHPPAPVAPSLPDQDTAPAPTIADAFDNRLIAVQNQIPTDRGPVHPPVATEPNAPTASAGPQGTIPDKLYFKGVSIRFGGFAEVAGIYRSRSDVSDISSSFSRIPFPNSPLAHTSELRGSARQSRLSFLFEGDINTTTHAAFYSEFDFQAGAQTSNSVESNSYVPRIRHVYATADFNELGLHILAGQSWSLLTMNSNGVTPRNEVPPAVIDGQYVPGFVWTRQPQIRLVKDWNRTFWAALSVENPQSSFAAPATGIQSTANGISALAAANGVSGFDSANTLSINHLPDVVGKVAYEPMLGGTRPVHLEAFGIWRSYSDRISISPGNALGLPPGNANSSADGWGVGGGVMATVIPKWLDVQGSVLTGRGIGRYGSAQLSDATLEPDGKIAPIRETIFLLGATFHATPELDFYVFAGRESQDARYFDAAGGHFGFGNPAANLSVAACTTEGGICAPNIRRVEQITGGFWQKIYTGTFGQVRFGAQYSHTELRAFAGSTGFAPKTSDDMVFTSLRYYLP